MTLDMARAGVGIATQVTMRIAIKKDLQKVPDPTRAGLGEAPMTTMTMTMTMKAAVGGKPR